MTQQTAGESLRAKIGRIPVVGYALWWGWTVLRLPRRLQDLRIAQNENYQKTTMLEEQCKRNGLLADDHDLDKFYIEFENNFRGTEAEIKERLRVYLDHFRATGINFDKNPVLDIGCGRGELLDLLKENNIRAVGVDLNEDMVKRCRERGLEAEWEDAFDYLRRQPEGSVGAITGFHIVEHIPFGQLLRLFTECLRALAPGGIVIFETPNPENIDVGSYTFYFDPSHLHPLAPDVLAFALRNRGFHETDILRLHPKGNDKEWESISDPHVAEVVKRFYMARDFAVIGHKKNWDAEGASQKQAS